VSGSPVQRLLKPDQPVEYERRVIGFFDRVLLADSA